MASDLVKRALAHVQRRLSHETSGHDWNHTWRVWQIARYLQSKEGGDLETIEVAALLHCAAEHDLHSRSSDQMRAYTMVGILDVLDIQGELRDVIIETANWCRFKGRDTERPTILEGKIVQDANFLETLGAIGVARVFTAGGYLGRAMYDPAIKYLRNPSNDAYQNRKRTGTTINYFYEKSLQVINLFNTETAKKIAEPRLAFTKLFLEQFLKEWDGEYRAL